MVKFLCVQHTSNGIEAALFYDNKLIDKIFEDKKRASKYFVTAIASLLENNNCNLDQISFIATNRGPGPFTTLRVVLASVNGLAFATKKPMIGIDGLDAILQEYWPEKNFVENLVTVALLDACSKDVYFGISFKNSGDNLSQEDKASQENGNGVTKDGRKNSGSQVFQENKGCKNIEILLQDLKKLFVNKKIYFIGNGSEKYRENIIACFGDMAIFDKIIPVCCSVEQIGKMAFEQWKKKEGLVSQVLPSYLKSVTPIVG